MLLLVTQESLSAALVIFDFALLLLFLAAELDPGAPVAAEALTSILGSTLWIGSIVAGLLFLFAPRLRRLLESAS